MHIRLNDKVMIIAGKDKGKTGKVVKIIQDTVERRGARVVVEGINKVKRHLKPGVVSKEGGIVEVERPLNISNVMFFDDKANKPTKIGFKIVDGKKYRVSKKTGETIM